MVKKMVKNITTQNCHAHLNHNGKGPHKGGRRFSIDSIYVRVALDCHTVSCCCRSRWF